MDAGMFTWLETLSPWWWVALGVGLGALEMVVFSFTLIWPGIAAIFMALLVWIVPGISGEVQVAIFAILSIVLMFAGRSLVKKFGDGQPKTNLNNRTEQMIGRQAKVVGYDLGEGHVEIDGLRWVAKWPDGQSAEIGQVVKIVAAEGMSVQVENI